MNRYYQTGGEQQLMQLFQLFANAVQDDEFSTAEEVMQMFQQLSPEEQQAFVQQAMQIVQQAPQEEQMELEEEPTMQRGGYVNNTGYLEGYETSKNPFNIIKSNRITMKGVDPKIKYIKGTDNLGNTQYMEHGGEYEFDGDFVVEEPVYAQTGGSTYEKMLRNPEVQELLTMRENKKAGYLRNIERYKQLEGKYSQQLEGALKQHNRIERRVLEQLEKESVPTTKIKVQSTPKPKINSKVIPKKSDLPPLDKSVYGTKVSELEAITPEGLKITFDKNKGKFVSEIITPEGKKVIQEVSKDILTSSKKVPEILSTSAKVSADVMSKEEQLNAVFRFNDLVNKVKTNQLISPKETTELNLLAKQLGEAVPKSTFLKSKFPNILETVQEVSKGIADSKFGKVTGKVLKSPITKGVLNATEFAGMVQGAVQGLSYDDKLLQLSNDSKSNPIAKSYLEKWNKSQGNEDVLNEYVTLKKNQFKGVILPEDKPLPKISKGVDYQRIFGGKQETPFEFLPKTDNTKSTSLKQDKPKSTLPSKKLNKKVAEQVATPDVLIPPPVPTELPEELNYDFRVPLMDLGNYYIPQEEREVNLNPNAFNRTNIGVGKHFFKQYGGATETNFKSRFNPNADINIGAETEQQFYQPYTNKMRLYPNIQLDPVAGQYDSLPMGANSMNYQAPNAQSRKMFEGKGSNQLLDLGNYASRFDENNFGMTTQPVSNQTVDRKSKFQEFMDKYGKKSDLEFNPNVNQVAPYYNLMKASEPLAGQYRANVDLKYAETPLLDPLPVIQQIQNQQRLATQNINTNSPTGQSYLSNLTAQTQQKTVELLNDVQQKNAQIAAQNEQARIAAYNQEQQLNIAANQQYLQNQMLAEANRNEMMGSALSDIDRIRNQRTKTKNDFNSLAAITPGLKKSTNLRNLLTGEQGFEIDPKYAQLQYYNAQYKTPQQVEAEQKAKVAKQTGGSINQFFKKRIS